MNNSSPTNSITVDVEDYFQVSAFAGQIKPDDWPHFSSRVEQNTHSILRLFSEHEIQGTFFILGWIAERYPNLVKQIQSEGHEIGCHSYWHRLVYDLTPEEFCDDTKRARDVLEDITAEPVRLYRAPSFSITKNSLWALELLAELGFTGDSSIYPTYHDRYGIPNSPHVPYQAVLPMHNIVEFPGTVAKTFGMSLPVSGGGYFRLYPLRLTEFCLRQFIKQTRQPFMFYIHPWEIDPDQPRLQGSFKSRFRHYQNLRTTYQKLNRFLSQFEFGSLSRTLAELETLPEFRLDGHRIVQCDSPQKSMTL